MVRKSEIGVLVASSLLIGVGFYLNFNSSVERVVLISYEIIGAGLVALVTTLVIMIEDLFD